MDDKEYERILAKYEPYIRTMATSLTVNYPSIREDVEQEMRLAVWDNTDKDTALLKRILRCRAIDFLRRYTQYDSHRAENVQAVSYEQREDWGYNYAQPSHEERIIDRIFIKQLLRSLPAGRAGVIEEFYLDGRELKDIGRDRGVSESRACQWKGEGIAHLRRIFGDDFS